MARARKRKKIATRRRLHQEPIIREIARLLDTGVPTKFRWSSAAHHGLRAALCLKGEKWARANSMAGEIVTLALHRIGASRRPSWHEGRLQTQEREYRWCQGCTGYMGPGASRPWCSDECWKLHYDRRLRHHGGQEEKARRYALGAVVGGPGRVVFQHTERQCAHCNKTYVPVLPKQKYCTQHCATQVRRRFESRDCLICAESFAPGNPDALYCGPKCFAEAANRRHRAARAEKAIWHERICQICNKPFKHRWKHVVRCSRACLQEADRRKSARKYALRHEQRLKCEATPSEEPQFAEAA